MCDTGQFGGWHLRLIVEEIKIRKDTRERDEVVRGTVHKQDVEVDEVEGEPQQKMMTPRTGRSKRSGCCFPSI